MDPRVFTRDVLGYLWSLLMLVWLVRNVKNKNKNKTKKKTSIYE